MSEKWVYLYNEVDEAEEKTGSWEGVRGLLGGKGANLAEMTRMGMPVPPGFVITTEACTAFLAAGERFPETMWQQTQDALNVLAEQTGKLFNNPAKPLLVSCRSGAKFSMPGMMDTVLNIGLNDDTARGMIELTGDPAFVYDSYRRVIEMTGTVVFDIPDHAFETPMHEYKSSKGYLLDTELKAEDWEAITNIYKKVIREHKGFEFPQDPHEQLRCVVEAVFKSWNGKRAGDYRKAAGIANDLGTAVNVVTMVFGNMGDDSGTGVAFTRNPSTGEKVFFGEYLLDAQGEDVVAGIRNTNSIAELGNDMPPVYKQLVDIGARLEKHFKDMQDVEFTIEHGKLWMLQTRVGKRTPQAAVNMAVEMANEGLISKEEAVMRVTPEAINALLHPQFSQQALENARKGEGLFVHGVNASPGAAVGQVYFDADTAEMRAVEHDEEVIMVRPFTKPDDVHGMLSSQGILTSEGGATSHAAVVARQFGIPCVCGASDLYINVDERYMKVGETVIKEGEWISLNGSTGEVFQARIETSLPDFEHQQELLQLLDWADDISNTEGIRQGPKGFPTKGLEVWANADYPDDARRARKYGARGIGLCRTEHMFFEPERLPVVQRAIMASSAAERGTAINELLPFQRADFEGLFEVMAGLPVIIRLIDPPLHEFLPAMEGLIEEVATMRATHISENLPEKEVLLETVRSLHESNPMMGLRGVRLSIMMPEMVEMQVRAIFEAAANVTLKGISAKPEVMVPLTGHINELKANQPRLEQIATQVMQEKGVTFRHKFGTMIEIPRAALTAGEIATVAEFFSYGTNDLTQMTFGYSRDDAESSFLLEYVEKGILPENPFQTIDKEGVGRLMRIGCAEGRVTRPDLEVGICGEHGGDPKSIRLCFKHGFNYVSCSPFRVPVARLAAAQAALEYIAAEKS